MLKNLKFIYFLKKNVIHFFVFNPDGTTFLTTSIDKFVKASIFEIKSKYININLR